MHKFCIPAIAAACLFALPALSATATTSDSASTTPQNALPAPAATATTTPQNTTQIQEQLRQDLSKAGYSDIQIMPGSFLVRAKDKLGQPDRDDDQSDVHNGDHGREPFRQRDPG
jgi:hypothetical protein